MKRALYITAVCILSLINLTGCETKSSAQDKILVTVANKFITLKDYKDRLSKLPSYYMGITEKNKKNLLDDIIVESLFLEDAIRKGVDRDKEVKDILNEAKKKVIIAKFIKSEVDDKIKVSDDEMKKFYEENKENFKKPQMWRASHILVASEGEAKDILKELSLGKSFEDLARQKSIDATATRGGDVGYFRKGQVVPEFENTCFNLKVGQTSEIVRTQFGYHIIKLTDKKDETVESFEEARPAIENELKFKKRSEMISGLIMDLKNKYRVRVEDDAMKALSSIGAEKKSAEKK